LGNRKLPNVKVRNLLKIFKAAGYEFSRQRGSHAIYKNDEGRRVTVPIHPGKTLTRDTLSDIIDDMGLTKNQFIDLYEKIIKKKKKKP